MKKLWDHSKPIKGKISKIIINSRDNNFDPNSNSIKGIQMQYTNFNGSCYGNCDKKGDGFSLHSYDQRFGNHLSSVKLGFKTTHMNDGCKFNFKDFSLVNSKLGRVLKKRVSGFDFQKPG